MSTSRSFNVSTFHRLDPCFGTLRTETLDPGEVPGARKGLRVFTLRPSALLYPEDGNLSHPGRPHYPVNTFIVSTSMNTYIVLHLSSTFINLRWTHYTSSTPRLDRDPRLSPPSTFPCFPISSRFSHKVDSEPMSPREVIRYYVLFDSDFPTTTLPSLKGTIKPLTGVNRLRNSILVDERSRNNILTEITDKHLLSEFQW